MVNNGHASPLFFKMPEIREHSLESSTGLPMSRVMNPHPAHNRELPNLQGEGLPNEGLQFSGVGVESPDPLGKFVRRHGVFVVKPSEVFLVQG